MLVIHCRPVVGFIGLRLRTGLVRVCRGLESLAVDCALTPLTPADSSAPKTLAPSRGRGARSGVRAGVSGREHIRNQKGGSPGVGTRDPHGVGGCTWFHQVVQTHVFSWMNINEHHQTS